MSTLRFSRWLVGFAAVIFLFMLAVAIMPEPEPKLPVPTAVAEAVTPTTTIVSSPVSLPPIPKGTPVIHEERDRDGLHEIGWYMFKTGAILIHAPQTEIYLIPIEILESPNEDIVQYDVIQGNTLERHSTKEILGFVDGMLVPSGKHIVFPKEWEYELLLKATIPAMETLQFVSSEGITTTIDYGRYYEVQDASPELLLQINGGEKVLVFGALNVEGIVLTRSSYTLFPATWKATTHTSLFTGQPISLERQDGLQVTIMGLGDGLKVTWKLSAFAEEKQEKIIPVGVDEVIQLYRDTELLRGIVAHREGDVKDIDIVFDTNWQVLERSHLAWRFGTELQLSGTPFGELLLNGNGTTVTIQQGTTSYTTTIREDGRFRWGEVWGDTGMIVFPRGWQYQYRERLDEIGPAVPPIILEQRGTDMTLKLTLRLNALEAVYQTGSISEIKTYARCEACELLQVSSGLTVTEEAGSVYFTINERWEVHR